VWWYSVESEAGGRGLKDKAVRKLQSKAGDDDIVIESLNPLASLPLSLRPPVSLPLPLLLLPRYH
jgi:hypothetical protein